MAEDAAGDRWSALQPWLDVLNGRLAIYVAQLPSRDDMSDVWITLHDLEPEDFEPSEWTWFLEGLELLDLAVRVAPHEGWDLVFSLTVTGAHFVSSERMMFPRKRRLPRYVVPVHGENLAETRTMFLALRRLIGSDEQPYEPRTRDFLRVRQVLLTTPWWQGL